MPKPVLVIHGGAGVLDPARFPPERELEYKSGLKDALLAGYAVLDKGGNALDAVCAAVVSLEGNPLFNSGKGAVFDIQGKHELEASVAVSKPPSGSAIPESRRCAAVTLLKHVKHPILLAKELYLDEKACPHAFLSGPDAERIAQEKGLEMVDEHYFDTEMRWREHRRGLGLPDDANEKEDMLPAYDGIVDLSGLPKETVGAVALDVDGMLACATSTGGKTNKNVGRIGDTPSMGSGFWSSTWTPKPSLLQRLRNKKPQEQGVAISGTGDGDFYVRNAATHDVAARMRYKGYTLKKAATQVVDYLRTQGGEGGMIAVDAKGNYAMPLNCTGMFRGVMTREESTGPARPRVAIWATDKLEEV